MLFTYLHLPLHTAIGFLQDPRNNDKEILAENCMARIDYGLIQLRSQYWSSNHVDETRVRKSHHQWHQWNVRRRLVFKVQKKSGTTEFKLHVPS